jgi:Fe2+ transport system protein FeoA
MTFEPLLSLNRLPAGWRGKVMRIQPVGSLRIKLARFGIMRGTVVEKVRTLPGGRGILVRVDNAEHTLTTREADSVLLEVVGEHHDE